MTPRLYQETILGAASLKNTLVVLPTGLGKTAIALLLALQRQATYPGSKIVFLAPTKPLCEQHIATFKKHLGIGEATTKEGAGTGDAATATIDISDDQFALFTGEVAPAKRQAQWNAARYIFSTPQGLENDIISNRLDLSDVSLMIFDEAHRAVGDYSYVFLAKRYVANARAPRVLALTASPGANAEHIMEVCTNLHVEHVEMRSPDDPDVKPYVQETQVRHLRVELSPEILAARNALRACLLGKVGQLRQLGLVKYGEPTRRELLAMQIELRGRFGAGERDGEVLKGISVVAEAMKIQHGLELIESQGIAPLVSYMQKLEEEAASGQSKAVRNLVVDPLFKSAKIKADVLMQRGIEHPKIAKVRELCEAEFKREPKAKIILFTQYRDTAAALKRALEGVPGVLSEVFVGQAKKNGVGLSQKQQAAMLAEFTDGFFNVLIATCVAEEGLDIPSVDLVIFYEPVPSAIRTIQRRGRTGRHDTGRVVMLITKATRDEAYASVARNKEKNMGTVLNDMRSQLNRKLLQQPQATLTRFETKVEDSRHLADVSSAEKNKQTKVQAKPPAAIYVDYREKASPVVKQLLERDANVQLEMLSVGDFVCSGRCGIEFKQQQDFVDSILDGRLLEQLRELKRSYERPLIVVQGDKDIYTLRNVHPNAIRGMIAAITVAYGVPLVFSKDEHETAQLLMIIAEREQNEGTAAFSPHASRKPACVSAQQEYVVSALPAVGPVLAKELLKTFGSIRGVANASDEQLRAIEGVGEKKAKTIFDFVNKTHEGAKSCDDKNEGK